PVAEDRPSILGGHDPCRSRPLGWPDPGRRGRARRGRPGRPSPAPRPARRHLRDRRPGGPVAGPAGPDGRPLPGPRCGPRRQRRGVARASRARRPRPPDVGLARRRRPRRARSRARRPVREAAGDDDRRGRPAGRLTCRESAPPRLHEGVRPGRRRGTPGDDRGGRHAGRAPGDRRHGPPPNGRGPACVRPPHPAGRRRRSGRPRRAAQGVRPPGRGRARPGCSTGGRAALRQPPPGQPRPRAVGDPGGHGRDRPPVDRSCRCLARGRLAAVRARRRSPAVRRPGDDRLALPRSLPGLPRGGPVPSRRRLGRARVSVPVPPPRPHDPRRVERRLRDPAADRVRLDRRGLRDGAAGIRANGPRGRDAADGDRRRPDGHPHLPADRRGLGSPARGRGRRRSGGGRRVTATGHAPAIIHLVPHTHWDREWYEPFQVFRMRLVELVDQLLDSMEADDRMAFTLDGQMATIDDYLEVRPEGRARIERLIADGRLAIGPWQILMDEFLVSGETIVRNLEIGWHAAEAFGGAMPVGYLPDMFGHVAQMPQILRRAGIRHAVVWRGVPAAIDRHAFDWVAPDGSTVRAEYLVGGYGNGAYLLAIPDRLADKVARYVAASRPFYGDRSILAMYGTDHAVPSPRLARIVADANAQRDDIAVRIETLSDYIRAFDAAVADPAVASPAPAPEWTGELRSAARANMLMNVTSARIDIKVAAARAERA